MPSPAPADYLQPDETSLRREGRHPLSVLDDILGATLLAAVVITAVLVLAIGFFPRLIWPLAMPVTTVTLLALAAFLVSRYWRVTTSLYIITNERVYKAHGRLRFFGSQTTYDKLTDMHVYQGIFGRLYGFGTVRLETAGTGIALQGVRDPFGVKQHVEDARFAFVRTLLGEHKGSRQAAPTVAPERAPQQTLWQGGIAPVALVGGLILASLLVLVGLATLPIALAQAPAAGLPSAAFVFAGVLSGVSIVVRYRFTQYHIASQGVVVAAGWLTRRRVETTYEKVTDVTMYQGVLGRIFDFGSITINTAGSNVAPVVFGSVREPEAVKQRIDDARRAWEQR